MISAPKISQSAVPGKSDGRVLFKKLQSLLGWRLAGMGISAAGSIWASRCLGPDSLGISATVQAVTAQALIFTHFGQNNYLIRQYKTVGDLQAQRVLVESVIMLRLVATAILVVGGLAYSLIHGVPAGWILAIAAGTGAFILEAQSPDWVLQAQENQAAIYKSNLWSACFASACYIIFFRPGVGPGANLLVGFSAGILMRALTYRAAMADFGRISLKRENINAGFQLAWRGRYFFITAIVVYIYTQGEQMIIASFRPLEELGRYKAALQLSAAATPLFAIVTSLLYPRFIEWRKIGSLYLWKKQVQLGILSMVGWAIVTVALILLLPTVYIHVFGQKFQGGAFACAILISGKMLAIPVCIFVNSLWAHGKDRTMLAISAGTAVVSLTLNLILIPRYGIPYAALVGLLSEALMLVAGIYLSRRLAFADAVPAVS